MFKMNLRTHYYGVATVSNMYLTFTRIFQQFDNDAFAVSVTDGWTDPNCRSFLNKSPKV